MSASMTEFDAFDVGVDEIVEILKSKISNKIILERAEKIDPINKEVLLKSGSLKYVNLISTIPMNVFLFLCGRSDIAKMFMSYPTTFIYSEMLERCPFNDFQGFDYVYDSSQEHAYHRLTKVTDGVVFEYKGDDIKTLEYEKDRVEMKVGQLIQTNIVIRLDNVEFFGRYATWNHGIKTNELLKQLYETKTSI